MDIDGLLGLVIFIFFLILLNGFFSSAEIAIISSKRSIIDKLSKEGNLSAQMVGKMKSDPERFLATVQVGVTFVSTLASVLAGVASSKYIEPIVLKIPYKPIHQFSETIAIFSIVIVIAYLTLVIGELVPKSIALRFAEKLAMFSARILNFVSKVSSPVIFILTTSTRIVLKTLGIKEQSKEVFVSEEEIKFYIKEGKASGVLEETEAALLHGVFEFSDITVKDVMVTKPKISAIDVSTPPEKILKKVVEDGYSRYPIYKDNVDHVEGILFNKDLFKAIEQEKPIVLKDIMREPYFVPDSIMISKLLRDMQKRKFHIAMVVNEHGDVDGLVTIEDIIEEIVGEIEDEADIEKEGILEKLSDGSVIVEASASMRDLENMGYKISKEIEEDEFSTIAGYMLHHLQRIPKGGEFVLSENFRLSVVDVEENRIEKIKIEEIKNDKEQIKKAQ